MIRAPLLLSAGVITVAATFAAPAHADPIGDSFLTALTNAGIPYSAPAHTIALGQSVCPMLMEPGRTFDAVNASVVDSTGLSNEVAGMFTLISIAQYCPAVMSPLLPHRLQS